MTRGYLTFAQNNGQTDYLNLAYLQAMSIKATQQINNYTVVVDEYTGSLVTEKHLKVFDHVVAIPGGDDAAMDSWKLKNEWKALAATPYDETVKVEADMLFTSSVDHWWDIMAQQDVCFTTDVVDYRGAVASNRAYRRIFDQNGLLNVYTGFYYFKRSQRAARLFDYARLVYANWSLFSKEILKGHKEQGPDTDLVFAIAAKLCGDRGLYNAAAPVPRFAHMKGAINGWEPNRDWRTVVHHQFDQSTLTVGFTRQQVPFHYHYKNFATPNLIDHYEQLLSN
jgi:hypothetical protein